MLIQAAFGIFGVCSATRRAPGIASNYQMREITRRERLTCRIDIARIPNREKA
jgi:hypothetical protein